jgi:NADP-dependent 3-hydroxy acid dehydrogenase YdfG
LNLRAAQSAPAAVPNAALRVQSRGMTLLHTLFITGAGRGIGAACAPRAAAGR